MAKICPVCNEKIGFFEIQPQPGFFTHPADCEAKFLQSPEIFGGKAIEKTEADIEAAEKKVEEEYAELQQKIEDKSVHVKSFDMPFGDMVGFMVKWALASIPAFIILAIIGAIFFAIFGSLFF